MLYWFAIWREFKLSIAEILAIFPDATTLYSEKSIMIMDWISAEEVLKKAPTLGWTIKIFELKIATDMDSILSSISNIGSTSISKFNYGLNLYWEEKIRLAKMLMNVKRHLKWENISSRFVNKNDVNLSSAQILWNSLLKKWADLNIVDLGWIYYFWRTVWVQDIDAYSARDYWKSRDMDIWMLPPKLSQMMINISRNPEDKIENIYDPFIWLWTILIEWAYMGIKKLYWSDFNPKMVQESKSNLWNLKSNISWLEINIIEADARDTNTNDILKNNKIDCIITEWFLWEVMTQKNITNDRINVQKNNLSKLYEKFFSGLKTVWFDWNIVISFPFWDVKWKYVFFEEVYDILNDYCDILPLFPSEFDFKETKSWSLLYKRQKQLVWREIFKLKIKT
jgi:tRNA G10  N-methylase Trm11